MTIQSVVEQCTKQGSAAVQAVCPAAAPAAAGQESTEDEGASGLSCGVPDPGSPGDGQQQRAEEQRPAGEAELCLSAQAVANSSRQSSSVLQVGSGQVVVHRQCSSLGPPAVATSSAQGAVLQVSLGPCGVREMLAAGQSQGHACSLL